MVRTSPLLNVMSKAAQNAGRSLRHDFGEIEQLQVSQKGPGDFVSSADLAAEKIIFEELSQAREGYGFLMEEQGEIKGSDKTHRWIIDPLDGTNNFLHGLPHFCTSIALEREGKLVAGVVYDPISDETFWGEKGKGSFCNNRRLRVSARNKLEACNMATGHFRHESAEDMKKQKALTKSCASVRILGSSALDLCWLAAGRFDFFWEPRLSAWDMAAAAIIITEAGGMISDDSGGSDFLKSGRLLATNSALHDPLLSLLKKA